jgi:CBS domain-containing protein
MAVQAAFAYLSVANLLLAVFNLIPGFPLDGGRVLRAAVWHRTGDRRRADQIAFNSGQIVGFIFFAIAIFLIITGDFLNGLWIGAIGWFIQTAAMQYQAQSSVQNLLEDVKVAQAMSPAIDMVSSRMMVRQLIEEYVLGQGKRFFVVSDGEMPPRGIVTLSSLIQVPRDRWDWTSVTQVVVPWRQVVTVTPETPLLDALELLSKNNLNQVPVVEGDQIVGMLSREMIIRYIQLRSQLETGVERADQLAEQERRYAEAP